MTAFLTGGETNVKSQILTAPEGLGVLGFQVITELEALGVVFNRTETSYVAEELRAPAFAFRTNVLEVVGELFAQEFKSSKVYAVVGIGENAAVGAKLAHCTATKFGTEVLAAHACRSMIKGITLGIPDNLLVGKPVLIVTDVLASGSTLGCVLDKLRIAGAGIVGIAAMGKRLDASTRLPQGRRVFILFGVKRYNPQ